MEEEKLRWIDNPYRTIVEYAELQIMRGGATVMNALDNLELKFEDTNNEVAKERVQDVITYVRSNYDKRYLTTKNYLLQGMIIQDLKQNIHNI